MRELTLGFLIVLAISVWFEIGLLMGAYIVYNAWPLALGAMAITSVLLLGLIRRMP